MGTQWTHVTEGTTYSGGDRWKPLDLAPLGAAKYLGTTTAPWGDPMGTAWPLDKGHVLLPGLGTLQRLQTHFQNKKERDLGACDPLMSIKPPSKNRSFPTALLMWASKNPSSPNSQPVPVHNRTGTTGEPRPCGARGEAAILLSPALPITFSTRHRSLETPFYWEVGKKLVGLAPVWLVTKRQ